MKPDFLSSPTPPQPIRGFLESFRPPFKYLWLIALGYFALCYLVFFKSQILKGNLPDPDDYMYLVQVMDWMKGVGWYDNIQHRLNPPDGVMIHFSRLAMIPMAGMVWVFERFGLGPRGGSMLMAVFYPLILFGGFLVTLRRVAASFMPRDWAGVTAYVALFSTALTYMFQPGHVDHHGLIIWVVAAVMGCALHMMEEPEDLRWGLGAGALLALGLVLALEILPWLLIIAGWLGLWGAVKGRTAARHGLAFALALHLASIIGLLLTRPPADFFVYDVLTYSVVYVFLTGGIAVAFAAVAVAANAALPLRLLAGSVFAALTGFLFLHRFPDLIAGPYGAMDPYLVDLILEEAGESQPLLERIHPLSTLAAYLASTLMALVLGAYFFIRAARKERWLWGLTLTLLAAAFGLTVFYQSRFAGVMCMAAVFPLAAFLHRGWVWTGAHLRNLIVKILVRIGLVLLVAPLPGVALPALANPDLFMNGVFLFPAGSDVENLCDAHELEKALNDPDGLGAKPHSIISATWLGPEILFRTPHSVLAAPFPKNVLGNLDTYRFFSTLLPEEAKTIAERRCIDLVVACTTYPASYLHNGPERPGASEPREFGLHFIKMLMGETPPDWLTEVSSPAGTFFIYEVQPTDSGDANVCPAR